jgi:hypothetical protein
VSNAPGPIRHKQAQSHAHSQLPDPADVAERRALSRRVTSTPTTHLHHCPLRDCGPGPGSRLARPPAGRLARHRFLLRVGSVDVVLAQSPMAARYSSAVATSRPSNSAIVRARVNISRLLSTSSSLSGLRQIVSSVPTLTCRPSIVAKVVM